MRPLGPGRGRPGRNQAAASVIRPETMYVILAAAFAEALRRPVEAVTIARDRWVPWLTSAGFSPPAAGSMAAVTALTLEDRSPPPASPERGATTLASYIQALVRNASS